jgi:hypothetical protein
MYMRRPIELAVALPVVVVVLGALAGASPAFARSPWWHVSANLRPSDLQQGGDGTVVLQALNVGDGQTSGSITVTGRLPAGVTVQKVAPKGEPEPRVSFKAEPGGLGAEEEGRFHGEGLGPEETDGGLHACSEPARREVTCTYPESFSTLNPYEYLEMGIAVKAETGWISTGVSAFEVSGGEAPTVQIKRPVPVNESAPAFGAEQFAMVPEAEGGALDARAGSHPFQLTATFALNQTGDPLRPPALPRDLRFELPPGFVGNPLAVPQCSEADFDAVQQGTNHCPEDTAIGVVTMTVDEPVTSGVQTIVAPLFDLVPESREPARFGVEFLGAMVTLNTAVRTGSDYGLTISLSNITELANFLSGTITFWGVPGASSHNASRGWGCLTGGESCIPSTERQPPPFLTLPTSCASPFVATLQGDSWPRKVDREAEQATVSLPESEYSLTDGLGRQVALTGCNQLPFAPSVEVAPDVQQASTASGLTFDVHVPQETSENASGLTSATVKDITIALPQGVSINPAGANGVQGCSETQIGFEGWKEFNSESEPGSKTPLFSSRLSEPLEPGPNLGAEGFCPSASKIGTVRIATPILPHPLAGAIYLATQNENPSSSLIAIYLVAEDPISGTLVKLAGRLSLNPETGQITASFERTPQIPLENIDLQFFGGERALLATPAHCGRYTTQASFAPWSGEEPVGSQASFQITTGPQASSGPNEGAGISGVSGGGGRAGCPSNPLPFAPSLTVGTTNLNAGTFSPLTVTVGREDGQQPLQNLQLRLPPGVEGMLAGVPLCPEAQANAGACAPANQIGETTVAAGLGADPYILTGGKVYLTGPYSGTGSCTPSSPGCAPFGLAIVTPVKAGPLDLENAPENHPPCDCLVIRAKIEVDPQTAQLTIVTGGIPSIIDGIPLQIKDLNITINRAGFIFNPTSCDPMSVDGTIAGGEGAQVPVSSSFQVANCKNLKFSPKLTASTRANGEFAGHGASLHLVITTGTSTSPSSSSSTSSSTATAQADMRSLKLDLPQRLPARLETIQKACPEKTFDQNPAACPKASVVGSAAVQTPILSTTMTGPAYLVSKNGSGTSHPGESKTEKEEAAFPNLVLVLQGEGVRIDLTGGLFVSEKDITSVAFRTIPDVPIRRLDLVLPEGPRSILAASSSLCKRPLRMTTAITGQNGARLKPTVKVGVEGCRKPGKHRRHAKKRRPSRRRRFRAKFSARRPVFIGFDVACGALAVDSVRGGVLASRTVDRLPVQGRHDSHGGSSSRSTGWAGRHSSDRRFRSLKS